MRLSQHLPPSHTHHLNSLWNRAAQRLRQETHLQCLVISRRQVMIAASPDCSALSPAGVNALLLIGSLSLYCVLISPHRRWLFQSGDDDCLAWQVTAHTRSVDSNKNETGKKSLVHRSVNEPLKVLVKIKVICKETTATIVFVQMAFHRCLWCYEQELSGCLQQHSWSCVNRQVVMMLQSCYLPYVNDVKLQLASVLLILILPWQNKTDCLHPAAPADVGGRHMNISCSQTEKTHRLKYRFTEQMFRSLKLLKTPTLRLKGNTANYVCVCV